MSEPLTNVVFAFVITEGESSYKQYLPHSMKLDAIYNDSRSELVAKGHQLASEFFGTTGVRNNDRFLFNHGAISVQFYGYRVVPDEQVFQAISQILND